MLQIKPDDQDPMAAEVLVQGSVGNRTYIFLLDTGAAKSCLLFDDYTAAFESEGQEESSGLFSGDRYDLIEVPSVKLGPIERKPFTMHRQPQDSRAKHNLIGMDLLKDHRCHFLFSQSTLIIDPAVSPISRKAIRPLTMDNRFHPYLELMLGEARGSATWDTGAGVTVVDTSLIDQHPGNFQELDPSQGTDSTGETRETPMFRMHGLQLSGQPFPPHAVAAVDLSHINRNIDIAMDMILGYTSLRLADWYFDFLGHQWAVTGMVEPSPSKS